MDKRLILAKAGSGKTYYICNNLDENKRNIIVSYTNNNTKNIELELVKRFGYIPKNTLVMTYHSFVHKYLVRPYENTIQNHFYTIAKEDYNEATSVKVKDKISKSSKSLKYLRENYTKGLTNVEPEPQTINKEANYWYVRDSYIGHYMLKDMYYSSRICKIPLSVRCSEKTKIGRKNNDKLITKAMFELNRYVDYIYVDECQDFRKDFYELLVEICQLSNNIVLVGDYYQHSTNAKNNSGKPFKKGEEYVTFEDYIMDMKANGLEIDEKSLMKSRRCSVVLCEFIRKKLNVEIYGEKNKYNSNIKYLEKDEITKCLKNNDIVKLVESESNKYNFNSVNWGASKGDTYESICIVLTKGTSHILEQKFKASEIAQGTINKLYVAITRAKKDVYFIKYDDFKDVVEQFIII